jgi:hypothetical protein
MGGPCILASGVRAPACTDNFQVCAFEFDGREWQSCEQAYQAFKCTDAKYQEKIRAITKRANQNDSTHGRECWNAGQHYKASIRPDWYGLVMCCQ